MAKRKAAIERIRSRHEWPVLIVGGGVVGAGLFRELALQGVGALLVERGDVCCGASAGPSRMIHGGLRYLEYGEFGLVKESVTERNRLLRNAPHYVFPLPTTIPVTCWFAGLGHILAKLVGIRTQRPTHRGIAVAKLGLGLYDWFSRPTRVMPGHYITPRRASREQRPQLTRDIVCTATYYDAWISYPERLGLELLQDAEAACPDACAATYLSLAAGAGSAVTLHDELTGRLFDLKPSLIVNATGPWIDHANHLLGRETALIGGTKGGHVILENPELAAALGDGMVLYETPGGRVCIAFVWQGKPMIGSTDIRISDPDEAVCDDEEIDYILAAIRTPFPDIHVDRSQILSTFSGVRPLPRSDAATTGQVSRSHSCVVLEPDSDLRIPVYHMIGGKWTPFRAFAEQVADRLLPALRRPRKCDTHDMPIGGGRNYPADDDARRDWVERLASDAGVSTDRVATWLSRYGTHAETAARYITADTDSPLLNHPGYSRREIMFMAERERVYHLDDLLLRRTSIALCGELTEPLLHELAEICALVLGWTPDRIHREIDRAHTILRAKHGIDLHDDDCNAPEETG